jgi:hypothetical protein
MSDKHFHLEEEKLKSSVVEGYLVIILRDLNPVNRDKEIYRGLAQDKLAQALFSKLANKAQSA